MTSWVKSAGRIMVMGDSITLGWYSQLGGWRVGLGSALTSAGIGYSYVGPLSDAYGAHRAVIATAASQQTSAVQTDCATYRPRVVIIGWGANDVGGIADGGQGRTAAQAIMSLGDVIDWTTAGAPQAKVFVQTVVVPQTSAIASYWAARATFSELNGLLPALCTSRGATLIDIGAPTTSDGLHPDQTATGYPAMASTIYAAVAAALPG